MEFISHKDEMHAVIPVTFKITPDVKAMTDEEYEAYDENFELVAVVMGVEKVIATSKDFYPLKQFWYEIISEAENAEDGETVTMKEAYGKLRPLYKNQIELV